MISPPGHLQRSMAHCKHVAWQCLAFPMLCHAWQQVCLGHSTQACLGINTKQGHDYGQTNGSCKAGSLLQHPWINVVAGMKPAANVPAAAVHHVESMAWSGLPDCLMQWPWRLHACWARASPVAWVLSGVLLKLVVPLVPLFPVLQLVQLVAVVPLVQLVLLLPSAGTSGSTLMSPMNSTDTSSVVPLTLAVSLLVLVSSGDSGRSGMYPSPSSTEFVSLGLFSGAGLFPGSGLFFGWGLLLGRGVFFGGGCSCSRPNNG
jgi:hypothetical protein